MIHFLELSFNLFWDSDLKRNIAEAWKEMKIVYPKLYLFSCKYLHLIGTTVPAERQFSKAGAMASENRKD